MSVAKTLVDDLMAVYNDSQIPPFPPYYWWEPGGMLGKKIDYWYFTNDSRYNNQIQDGKTGPEWDFMTVNQSLGMGNDDQGGFVIKFDTRNDISKNEK